MTEVAPRTVVLDRQRRHPLYDADTQRYDLLSASYEGGEAYVPGTFLDQYLRETSEQYELRKDRAYYLNYTAAVVDAYISAVFRREPNRELTNAAVQEFAEDATGEGDTLTDFVREAMTWAVAALKAYVVVDIAQDGTPYAHSVHPANVLDYAIDARTGDYLWALLAEEHVEESDPFIRRLVTQRYRLWTPEAWRVFDSDGVQVEEESNTAGVVPLIEVAPGNLPLPMVDIARINRRIFNISSQIDEILVNVTFPQPYLQAGEDGLEDASGEAISPDVAPIQMGTTRMFLLPEGANMPPGYLTPPDGPIQRQMEERERLIEAIYSLAGLERKDPDAQRVQSGVAKSYDFKETNDRLAAIAQAAEILETKMLALIDAYGFTGEYNVTYVKDFDVRDEGMLLENYVTISETNLPSAVKRRAAMELAGQIADDATPDEKREIQRAVEDMADEAFDAPESALDKVLATPPLASPVASPVVGEI